MRGIALVVLAGITLSGPVQAEDLGPRLAASRAAVKDFSETLRNALQGAIKEGGPINAISVCNKQAPGIAATISKYQGLSIGRTSLKIRNPNNAPDEWELAVLKSFEEQKAAGIDPATLEHHEVVERDGVRLLRYMKAIPTQSVCLNCHGSKLAPDVAEKIKALYPDDKATGFSEGDLRGAFTISQRL